MNKYPLNDLGAVAPGGSAYRDTPFLRFWYGVNLILKDRGLPEMLYGEAKDWWQESEHYAR